MRKKEKRSRREKRQKEREKLGDKVATPQTINKVWQWYKLIPSVV